MIVLLAGRLIACVWIVGRLCCTTSDGSVPDPVPQHANKQEVACRARGLGTKHVQVWHSATYSLIVPSSREMNQFKSMVYMERLSVTNLSSDNVCAEGKSMVYTLFCA